MKNPTLKLLSCVCAVALFSACKKEVVPAPNNPSPENYYTRATGAIPDDPAKLAKIPSIVSSEFYNTQAIENARAGGRTKDTDADGIPDSSDACPTQKETVNGYMDNDGCPDTVPPNNADTDADGIPDSSDACPTQKETVNGYQDNDGCPDTIPDTDGDGINDLNDGCPTQAETINGYQDSDGCPDTAPVVLPPAPLPSSVHLTMPSVGNQGSEGSCVAWATSYARSTEAYYTANASSYSYTSNVVSPEFIYNQTKIDADCGSGTAFSLTLDLLKTKGVCTWQTMPYDLSNGCSLMPNATQNAEAVNYKIPTYSTIVETDITAIKTMLADKHPVMITVTIDGNFRNAYPGYIWNSFSGFSGNHALVICGYDDGKNAYKVLNSWGTAWGDAGYTWIDYNFFPTVSSYYVYVMK